MIDAQQVSSWVLVVLVFVGAGLFLRYSSDRSEDLADRWERVAAWLAAHGASDAEDEEEYARSEVRAALREERLRADLERVRHLVATDTYMSATRQIGNRIAYRQLLADTESFARRPALVPPARAWAVEAADLQTTRRVAGPETLDVRWR